MQFEAVVGAYLDAHPTLERNKFCLKRLSPHFSGMSLGELNRAHVRAYIAKREAEGVKQSTVRRELRLLSAAINFYRVEYGVHLPNPVASLALESDERRVRWLTKEDAKRLLVEADTASRPHLSVFIRLALYTGCRKNELLKLEWSRVDLSRKCFLLEAAHTKTRKRRSVALSDAAIAVLHRMRQWQQDNAPETPWVFGYERGRITTLKRSWATALRRCGIENFRIHDLRHTFASWLVMSNVSLYVVRDLLGHSSITQTEIYAHLAPSQHLDAVQKILLI